MRFIHLDSIDDERVAAYVNLTEIQLRNRLEPSKGLFIAESPKVIDRALAGWTRADFPAGRGVVDRRHERHVRCHRETLGR
mgnify:CR=1 FL=1